MDHRSSLRSLHRDRISQPVPISHTQRRNASVLREADKPSQSVVFQRLRTTLDQRQQAKELAERQAKESAAREAKELAEKQAKELAEQRAKMDAESEKLLQYLESTAPSQGKYYLQKIDSKSGNTYLLDDSNAPLDLAKGDTKRVIDKCGLKLIPKPANFSIGSQREIKCSIMRERGEIIFGADKNNPNATETKQVLGCGEKQSDDVCHENITNRLIMAGAVATVLITVVGVGLWTTCRNRRRAVVANENSTAQTQPAVNYQPLRNG